MSILKKIWAFIKGLVSYTVWLSIVVLTFMVANTLYINFGPTDFVPDYKLPGRILDMEGRSVHCIEQGQGADLVLVHDVGFAAEYYEPLIQKLADHYHVVAIDLLGHGYTDKPKDKRYDLTTHALLLRQAISSMNMQRPLFVAHGNAGAIVNEYAARYPGGVSGVVLINGYPPSPNVLFDTVVSTPLVGEAAVSLVNRMYMSRFVSGRGYANSLLVTERDVDVITKYWAIPGVKRSFLATARELKKAEAKGKLARQTQGGLIVMSTGEMHRRYPGRTARQVSEIVAPWSLKVSDDIGYLAFMEKPDLVASLIRGYFR